MLQCDGCGPRYSGSRGQTFSTEVKVLLRRSPSTLEHLGLTLVPTNADPGEQRVKAQAVGFHTGALGSILGLLWASEGQDEAHSPSMSSTI